MQLRVQTAPGRISFHLGDLTLARYLYAANGAGEFTFLKTPLGFAATGREGSDFPAVAFPRRVLVNDEAGAAPPDSGTAAKAHTEGIAVRRGTEAVGFEQAIAFRSSDGSPHLRETRSARLHTIAGATALVLDLACRFRAAEWAPITLFQSEPLLELLAASVLLPENGATLLPVAASWVQGTLAAPWIGLSQEGCGGLLLLYHSDNLRAPADWRLGADGLLTLWPFGEIGFTLPAAHSFTLRTRIILLDYPLTPEMAAHLARRFEREF